MLLLAEYGKHQTQVILLKINQQGISLKKKKEEERKKKSLSINLYNFIVASGNFNIHSQRGFFISLNWHWFICLGFFSFLFVCIPFLT